jgi:cell division transport system permease protein
MALNIGYWFIEGIRGIFLHKLTTSLTIAGMALSLWLMGVTYLFWGNLNDYRNSLFSGFQFDVFLETGLDEDFQEGIGEQITSINGIKSVEYISPREAAEIFSEEFGGEVFSILEYNPLPASYRVLIEATDQNLKSAQKLADSISSIDGVEEIQFQYGLIEMMEQKFNAVSGFLLLFISIFILGTIIVFFQGMKLSVMARKNIIYTLLVSGARHSVIRLPFIFEGGFIGLISGILSYFGVLITHFLINRFFIDLKSLEWLYLLIPVGFFWGLLTALIHVHKHPQSYLK